MLRRHRHIGLLLGVSCLGASFSAANANASDGFYKGKNLNVVVGSRAGGLADLDARLTGRFMARHLPGQPTLVVRNMPGAGSLQAANYLYSLAPKDGTEIGSIQRGIVMMPMYGQESAKFDARQFAWIGSRSGEVSLTVLWSTAPAKTFEDLRKHEIIVGSTGGGNDTHVIPLILNATTGTKFKVVSGYDGGSTINLAIERGEVHGRLGWAYNAMMGTKSDWVRDGKVRVIAQLAMKKHPSLPEVPLALDYALDERNRRVLELFAARQDLGFPLIAPPGLSPERVADLRQAFMKASADPDYLQEAKKIDLEVDPNSGEALQELVAKIYMTPPEIVQLSKDLLAAQGVSMR